MKHRSIKVRLTAWYTVLMALMAILVLAFVATPLSKRFGKREISIAGMLLSTAAFLICFLLRPGSVWVFTAFYVVAYLGLGVFNTVIWACIVDVIDYGEVKNGVREDGTIYACYSFARKLGQGGLLRPHRRPALPRGLH